MGINRATFGALAFLGWMALGAAPARGQAASEPVSVGVTVAVAVNVTELESDLLSDDLGKALAERFEVTVIAGEAARAKLPPDGLPETCIAETGCLGQTAAALGVEKLILLVAVRTGDDIQIDATLYDAASKRSESRPAVKMTDKRSQWKVAFAAAADSLLPGAKVRVITEPVPPASVDRPRGSKVHLYLFGAAAASVAIGAASGLWALQSCDWKITCVDGDPVIRSAVFDVGMGVGAALTIAAIVAMVKGADGADETGVGVRSGPGEIGLALGGSF